MTVSTRHFCAALALGLAAAAVSAAGGQAVSSAPKPAEAPPQPGAEYRLGPEDQIKIWALAFEEISEKPVRIDPSGDIDFPMLGRLHAGGLTLEQFRLKLLERLAKEVRQPQVSVEIVEYGSQPVSVLGAVTTPGVHQLRGRRTLTEVLSLAGGLRHDAGSSILITRRIEWGPIPLPSAKTDASGKFSQGELKVKDLLAAKSPEQNIPIRPHDVITVPTAETISVIGAVRKPGAFVLNERESVSALEALSMAEGLGSTPAPQDAKILRRSSRDAERTEIPVDLRKILAGKAQDVHLQPNDILFIPSSTSKKAAVRAMEAVIQTATGVVIWRRP